MLVFWVVTPGGSAGGNQRLRRTLVPTQKFIWLHNPENHPRHLHCCHNLKSRNYTGTLRMLSDSWWVTPFMLRPLMDRMRSPFWMRPSLSAGLPTSTLCTCKEHKSCHKLQASRLFRVYHYQLCQHGTSKTYCSHASHPCRCHCLSPSWLFHCLTFNLLYSSFIHLWFI